jgi:hypothetical protein
MLFAHCRRAALWSLVALVVALGAPSASAGPRPHSAQARGGVVSVDGAVRWRGRAVTSGLAWSARRDALAFLGRDDDGRARLVVLIVDDDLEPASLSWPVPSAALPARAVTWLGEGRVGAGPSELVPRMVAEYGLARPR